MRIEEDSIGKREISEDCLFGINTLRGQENFAISGRTIRDEPMFIHAIAIVKKAAALANKTIGALPDKTVDAIVSACDEILDGKHLEYFVIDMFEGSGGTSINMNVNEVIANRALKILGHQCGAYQFLHPNDHVNRGQSTNDVVPTALKLAVYAKSGALIEVLDTLAEAFAAKAREFDDVLRIGRTCMQAAQPMTLGQAMGGYAALTRRLRDKVASQRVDLLVVPLGGTAIGTGLGCAPGYRESVVAELSRLLGEPLEAADDMFDGMQNADTLARFSSELRIVGDSMGKIAADLIILCSGSNSGLGEVVLPNVQPGSSIMPGKVNPVMPMMIQQIAFAVTGNDAAVSLAALQGQLEINHFEPIMASRIFDSLDLLTNGLRLFTEKCIRGLEANREQSLRNLMDSSALASVFLPQLGYEKVTEIVKQSLRETRPFATLSVEKGLLSQDQVMQTLYESTRYQSATTQATDRSASAF
ncbi:MAG: aspartate ammonia-lyase [Pseudomonadota bacterium]